MTVPIELLYGRQAVRETLRAGRRKIHKILIAEGTQEKGIVAEILSAAQERGIPCIQAKREKLEKVSGGANHQGLAAEVSPYPYAEFDSLPSARPGETPLLLLLDELQDPQNLGSILRTAEAIGANGIIIPERRAVGVTPAVVHVSAGAAEHLRVARVKNLVRAIESLKERRIWVFGLENVPDAQIYTQADLAVPLALVIGSEGTGLRRLVREKCDLLLRLPMRGRVSSLNAAVATSIVLYEVLRQRGEKTTD